MTKRKNPPVQVRGRRPRISAFKRVETELANTRTALTEAAEKYVTALQALTETIAMLDASSFGGQKIYRCLTPAENARLDENPRDRRGRVRKQLVITPDCPRCHGPLWWVPCRHEGGCSGEHYECLAAPAVQTSADVNPVKMHRPVLLDHV